MSGTARAACHELMSSLIFLLHPTTQPQLLLDQLTMAPSRGKTKPTKAPNNKRQPAKLVTPAVRGSTVTDLPEPGVLEKQMPLELQQLLLNIFRNAFPERLGLDLPPLLQDVKRHLYNRDFLRAFGRGDYLEAYAVRWSASRALCYLQIFQAIEPYLQDWIEHRGSFDSAEGQIKAAVPVMGESTLQIVCLGGGAGAEIVALAGLLNLLDRRRVSNTDDTSSQHNSAGPDEGPQSSAVYPSLNISSIDIANWRPILTALHKHITTPPPVSKYASAAVKAAAAPPLLDPVRFSTHFHQADLLSPSQSASDPLSCLRCAGLVTMMFTLNELYAASLSCTQLFLHSLTAALPSGALLLVVDSPGSYSTVALGGGGGEKGKRYPMHWLLDLALLRGVGGDSGDSGVEGERSHGNGEKNARWEKLTSKEAVWFRLPKGLRYPIDLEDMRFQMHLYRRC